MAAVAKQDQATPRGGAAIEAEPLNEPEFLLGERPLSPSQRGDAMHLFLQHVDFSQPPDSLSAQLEKLIQQKILTAAQKSAISLDDVKWLMSCELGALLRKNKEVFRELPLNFPDPRQQAGDFMDRTMLRGRIDLLLPDENGFTLVDYKTDDVRSPGAMRQRVEYYTPQMQLYGDAIQKITGRRVHTALLVFLAARQVYTIPLE